MDNNSEEKGNPNFARISEVPNLCRLFHAFRKNASWAKLQRCEDSRSVIALTRALHAFRKDAKLGKDRHMPESRWI